MLLTIVKPGEKPEAASIDFPTVVDLVQAFIDRTYKKSDTDPAPVKVDYQSDSHAIYYSKAELDKLFAANTGADGLRIYIGMHEHTVQQDKGMPKRLEKYIHQHTVVLVCTKNKADMLDPNQSVNVAMEEGEICPPPPCQTAVDGALKP